MEHLPWALSVCICGGIMASLGGCCVHKSQMKTPLLRRRQTFQQRLSKAHVPEPTERGAKDFLSLNGHLQARIGASWPRRWWNCAFADSFVLRSPRFDYFRDYIGRRDMSLSLREQS